MNPFSRPAAEPSSEAAPSVPAAHPTAALDANASNGAVEGAGGPDADLIGTFARRFADIEAAIGRRIAGQETVVRQVVLGLLSEGHILLEGVPGLGKTELLKALADAVDLDFTRLQFTPDLMPADIVGTQVLQEDENGHRSFDFQEGPIFGNLVLADEINRATPKSQSALLEAMQERTVTVAGATRPLPRPFMVLATQNPIELEGTYPLPEAQLDRFLLKIEVRPPSAALLAEIINRTTGSTAIEVPKVIDQTELQSMIELATTVPIASHLVDYVAGLVSATNPGADALEVINRYVRHGASPRGAQAIVRAAKVLALANGRPAVSREDIVWALGPALKHRLVLNYEATADNVQAGSLLRSVLDAIAVPGPAVRGAQA